MHLPEREEMRPADVSLGDRLGKVFKHRVEDHPVKEAILQRQPQGIAAANWEEVIELALLLHNLQKLDLFPSDVEGDDDGRAFRDLQSQHAKRTAEIEHALAAPEVQQTQAALSRRRGDVPRELGILRRQMLGKSIAVAALTRERQQPLHLGLWQDGAV